MKTLVLPIVVAFLTLSGATPAQQSGEQKKGSSMLESMPDMMKGKQTGEGGMRGMGNMGNMMGMMKMMEQCNDMMKSAHDHGDKPKDTKQK
jgi:hypothetical protein